MDFIVDEILKSAEYDAQNNEFLEIWPSADREPKVISGSLRDTEELVHWLDAASPQDPPEAGGLRLLFQGSRPVNIAGKMDKIPFHDAATFRKVLRALQLPRPYSYVLCHMRGLAEVYHTPKTAEHGARLGLIVQATRAPRDWSLAMSVDLETRVVTAFFCVNDEVASRKILDHLNASCHLANHPMLLPAIVFKYYHYLAINQDRLRKKLRDIEYRLGQVQVRVDIREPHDNGHPSVLDNIESNMLSKELNLCNLQRAHNQSRYGRRRQTLEVLNKAMDWMWLECAPSGGAALQEAHYELQHLIATIGKLFDGLRMRDDYYNERIRSQLDTLSLLRAQRDQECGLTIARATMEENKLSSRIALAMRKETEDMKVLAHMGAVFLPANFLATLFGMNMFSFMSGNPTPSFSRWFFAYFGLYLLTTSFLIAAVYYFLSAWVPARRRLNQTKRTADDASLSSSCEEMRDKSLDDPSRGSFSTSPCSEHIILPESGQVTQIPTRDIV